MKAILLPFDKPFDLVEVNNKNLDDYYKHINCTMVETISFKLPNSKEIYIMWIDEEGKLKANPKGNPIATRLLLGLGITLFGIIVGKVLITKEGKDGEDAGLDKDDVLALCDEIRKYV